MIHLLWASLAIPILIHLVHRRKAKRVPISTLRFLRLVDQRVARRQRLKELLLLALRLLLLAALIGALYHPMIRSTTFRGANVPTAAAVVLDNTYSMRATAGGVSRFSLAKRAAADILDGLKTGDAASVILFDAQADTPPQPTTALRRLREELDAVDCGYGTAELAGALRRALLSLEQTALPRKELYIITDLQRLCWTAALEEFKDAFSPDLPVFLVDVGDEIGTNLALAGAEFGVNVQVAGAASELYCRLRNTGRRNAEKELALYLNGQKVHHRDVALAPGAEMTVTFSHVFGRTGDFVGEVRLESDELDADNARYFTVTVLDKLPVLLVNGDPSGVPYLNETFFLELALGAPAAGGRPLRVPSGQLPSTPLGTGRAGRSGQTVSPITTKTVTSADFLKQRLDDYGCVILANVPRLPELWADGLRRYVLDGGGLIIFTGDQVDSASYNTALVANGDDTLLPALLADVRERTGEEAQAGFRIRRLDTRHPIFRSLAESMDTHAARVGRFFSVTPHAEGGGTVVAELDGGPLLLEKKAGAGTVILWTSSADMDWNNLAARSFFLPVLHQTVYYASRSATRGQSVPVGMRYALELAPSDDPIEVEFFGPSDESAAEPSAALGTGDPSTALGTGDERLPVQTVHVPGEADSAVFQRTGRPGIYQAVYTVGHQEHRHLFAVNVEGSESELDRIEPEEARRMLGAPSLKVVREPERLALLVRRERAGLPLWDHLFALAILLAVAESFVGNVVLKH